jgi:hypothetical protein
MERARGCLQPVQDLAIFMAVFIPAFVAVALFHVYAARWEPVAIVATLVPGIVLTLLYLLGRRRLGWLMGMVGGLFLAFSFGLALFHGWQVQAEVVVGVGMVLILVGVAILLLRGTWRYRRAMEAINGATQDPLDGHTTGLFRDDGERIVSYPNRRRLLLQCPFQALLLAGLGSVLAFAPIHNPLVWGALGIVACVLTTVFLATLYRLLVRTPTLTVGPDGLLDNGSLLATGRGLLRWDEIHTMIPLATTSSGFVTNRYLLIVVPNGRAIRRRQPLWKQVLMLLLVQSSPYRLIIWQGLLDVPVAELAMQIAHYVRTHAPPGWIEPEHDTEVKDAKRPAQLEGPSQSATG